MSKQNKVNPGQYTQRGRLTQDDAAREVARQRSIGSEHTSENVETGTAKKPTGKTQTAKGQAKRPMPPPTTRRTAVLARNTGGGAVKPPGAPTRKKR